jgi:uncharacterized protein YcbK (DUF882 family)
MSFRRWSETHLKAVEDVVEDVVTRTTDTLAEGLEAVLLIPERPRSRWHRAGVTPRTERWLNIAGGLLLLIFASGWTWSIFVAPARGLAVEGPTTALAAGLASALDLSAPTTPYLTDAALRAFTPLRGRSGRLRASIQPQGEPLATDSIPAGAHIEVEGNVAADSAAPLTAPQAPGVWGLAIKVGNVIKPVTDFSVITLKPFSDKRRGRIGLYYLGTWPTEGNRVRARGYVTPNGFIEVTEENQDTYVSDHFRLRDFLTKGQGNVWPKYLVLDTKLVDKLELVLAELEQMGYTTTGVRVMSGFRTPSYNESGGDPSGRAALSRHMYGDAADIFLDNDGNGNMDDLNGDRRVNLRDVRIIEECVNRVERAHPALIGGTGIYPGTSAHGPFIHIDTRGFRARWLGSGDD